MTNYIQHSMLGIFRKETGLVINGSSEIQVARGVACYHSPSGGATYDGEIDSRFQNYNHVSDTFTHGFEFVEVTNCTHGGAHTGAFIATNIDTVLNKTATMDAVTWDDDTVTVGYYALGTGVTQTLQTLAADEEGWPNQPDGIAKALNTYGNINPTDQGLVFDHQMASSAMFTLTGSYQTAVENDGDGTIIGTWSFSNNRPWYITSIIVEFYNDGLNIGESVELEWYEDDTEIGYQRGGSQIYIGTGVNLSRVYCTEWDDKSLNPIAFGYLPVGMVLCSNTKIRVKHFNGTGGLCKVWLSGWYMPDDLVSWGAEELYSQPTVPAPLGLYTEDFFTSSDNSLTLDPNPCVCMDMTYRTHPHQTDSYRYGLEFVRNMTQNTYITTSLIKLDDDTLYFDPIALDDGDVCMVGYYTYETGGTDLMVEPGSQSYKGQINALVEGCNRLDRVDFGNQSFPYGDDNPGKFNWGKLFSNVLSSGTDYSGEDTLTDEWRDIFVFDTTTPDGVPPTMLSWGIRGGPPGMDETPFYPTAFLIEVDKAPIDPVGNDGQWDGYLELLMHFNSGTPNIRKTQSEYRYYPVNSPHNIGDGGFSKNLGNYLGAFTTDVGNLNENVENHVCYIPLGMMRCYGFKVQARVKSSKAFGTEGNPVRNRQCWLLGWYVDDS